MPKSATFVIETAPGRAREDAGKSRRERDRAQRRRAFRLLRRQRAREKPVRGRLHSRRSRLHEVLRVEVRARRVGAARRVDEGGRAVLEEGEERRERRVEAEEAVEIERGVLA